MTTRATIADACSLVTDGTHYTPVDIGTGYPFLTVKDVSDSGLDFGGCARISEQDFIAADSGNSAPKKGDVLFSKDGTVGKVHVVKTNERFAVLSSLAILRPKDGVCSDYLGHVLRFPKVLEEAVKRKTGSAIRRIVLSDLKQVQIPLPSLERQRRIAAILDKADVLRAKRREALAQLNRLAQSIFVEMFSPKDSQNWPVKIVEEIVSEQGGGIRTGPFGSQLLHSEFVTSGVAVLGIDNAVANEFRWGERRFITEEKYRELKRYTVNPGDVLITIMGTCGRCAVVPDNIVVAINTKHLCCITLNGSLCLPEFLHAYFLRHPIAREYLERTAKGAIMSGLNMGLIKAMPIPLPPLALQRQFVTRMKSLEAVKAKHRQALAGLEEVFTSIQHRAFQGAL